MDYKLNIDSSTEYLHTRVSGFMTRSSVSALTEDVFIAANRAKQSKVLIDVREFKDRLGVYDSLIIVRDVFPKYRGKGIRRAAIVDREMPGMRRWIFETIAQNRGYNFRMFREVSKALEWLLA